MTEYHFFSRPQQMYIGLGIQFYERKITVSYLFHWFRWFFIDETEYNI